jgi:hypothetical protein
VAARLPFAEDLLAAFAGALISKRGHDVDDKH